MDFWECKNKALCSMIGIFATTLIPNNYQTIFMKIFSAATWILITVCIINTQNVSAQMQKSPTLNHIALYVLDLGKSTAFYVNVVGLKIIPEPFHDGRHTWFKIGKHSQFHLISGAEAVTVHDKNSHICFRTSSIEKFIDRLNEHKISYENWAGETNKITIRTDGIKQIYFKDPDGYWIEINNDKY